MTNWNPRANELFLKARELPSAEAQQVFLERACAEDAALRAEVVSLLEASARAGSFLDSPVVGLPWPPLDDRPGVKGSSPVAEPIREQLGTVVGPYKLLQEIGQGGMGTVYMAEQARPV